MSSSYQSTVLSPVQCYLETIRLCSFNRVTFFIVTTTVEVFDEETENNNNKGFCCTMDDAHTALCQDKFTFTAPYQDKCHCSSNKLYFRGFSCTCMSLSALVQALTIWNSFWHSAANWELRQRGSANEAPGAALWLDWVGSWCCQRKLLRHNLDKSLHWSADVGDYQRVKHVSACCLEFPPKILNDWNDWSCN